MENLTNHGDIKLLPTNRRKSHLVSVPNYHTTKWFSEKLMGIEMKKTVVKIGQASAFWPVSSGRQPNSNV